MKPTNANFRSRRVCRKRYLPVDPADFDEDPDLDVFVRENPVG